MLSHHLAVQKCLRQAFEEEDKAGAGTLQTQECQAVIQSLARDMLQLTSQVNNEPPLH